MSNGLKLTDRRNSIPVDIGGVILGGDAPVVVQSMTNTDTADVAATVAQVRALEAAGIQPKDLDDEFARVCLFEEVEFPAADAPPAADRHPG